MECQKCKFSCNIPGDCHKKCNAPDEHEMFSEKSIIEKIMIPIEARANGGKIIGSDGNPIVELNPRGMSNGWCNWPLNFDPIWISSCKMFTKK